MTASTVHQTPANATPTLKLRDYQEAAIESVKAAWTRGIRRPLVVLPTGAGKTVVFAHLAAMMHERGVKTVVLAHREELIEQAAAKLRSVAPGLRVGIVKAARRETADVDVIVASVQSLARQERRDQLKAAGVRLVVVDESHHAVASTYMDVLTDLGCFDEDPMTGAYALGVTATPGRGDGIGLHVAWQEIVYQRSILDMIREGHLVNAKGIRVRVEGLDLSTVTRTRGDWQDAAVATAMHDALAPQAIVRAYLEHATGRQGVLFAPTVALAHETATEFTEQGITAAGIDGTTPADQRRDILARYARGDIQVLTNAMVLTEGWDAPWCSAVVIARPTSSTSLYIQMAGRALRPHPGKTDAIVLDVVGVTGKHKLASIADLAGAERVEKLPTDLAEYDEVDLLGLVDEEGNQGVGMWPVTPGTDGPLTSEIVDLFGTRRQAWLRTHRGVWFLPAGEHIVFLTPDSEPGRYSVAHCPSKETGGEYLREGLDLDTAMNCGEQYATDDAKILTRKDATWRTLEPTQGQLNAATRMGLPASDMTRGELSDAMSIATASRRIDGMPCVASVSEAGYW